MKFSNNQLIQSLLPEFIKSGIEEFTGKFSDIIREKNKEELFRLAHSWKGAAAQYEFPELAEKCKVLQDYSNNEDWANAELLGKEILSKIYEIKEAYDLQMSKKKFTFYKK
jgi:HPt (histidine-containing phosphotransfer) domain-containing protein